MTKPFVLFAAFVLLLSAVAISYSETEVSAFSKDLAKFQNLELEEAVASLAEYSSWSQQKQLGFLFATRPLTEGQEVGAYRLYFHARASVSTNHSSLLKELLKSADPTVRMYSLILLDIIRPPGLSSDLLRIAAFDTEAYVGFQASKMLGFYGLSGDIEQLRRIAKTLDPERLADLLFRFVSTTRVEYKGISGVVERLPASPEKLAIMAVSRNPDTYDIAATAEYRSSLLTPWLWQVLASSDPAKACTLFKKTIAVSVAEADIADYLDTLFQIAGTKSPEAAYEAALDLKARNRQEAYIRALTLVDLSSSIDSIRNAVQSTDNPLDKIQRIRYLVQAGDYSSLPEILKMFTSDDVKRIPRRQVWCANMLSYFFVPTTLAVFEKARAESKTLSARASTLGPIARVSPSKAEALIAKDIEQFVNEWSTAWTTKLGEDYTDTMSDLHNSFLSIMSGIAELPPEKGLPYVKKMTEFMDPWFWPEIFSATGWWCGNTATTELLSGHVKSKFPHVASAAANMLGFIGTVDDFKFLASSTFPDSLALRAAVIDAAARLACIDDTWGTNTARAEEVNSAGSKIASAAKAPRSPEEIGESKIGQFAPADEASWKRAAEAILAAGENSGLVLAILRAIQSKTGVRFVHMPDYYPNFTRHDVLSAIQGNFTARKAIR